MQLSVVVFGLVVLAAVLVKSGDARASPSKDERLDELTEELLARYVERRNQETNMQSTNTRSTYDNGPVRRFWSWHKPPHITNTINIGNHHSGNSGNIGSIHGGFTGGKIGNNQGRK